jgi:peptide/nickel transport system ATP-binding protein
MTLASEPLLTLRNLDVRLPDGAGGERQVIRNVSLQLEPGRVFALVGESGSGKTLLGRSLMGLLPPTARWRTDQLTLDGQDLTGASRREWRAVRGCKVGMIFQEPMSSLNPTMRIGAQIAEAMRLHSNLSEGQIGRAACELLARVRIPDPESALQRFPHQFSGGMRQRIMLASVLLPQPKLLIADEPTTALDSLVQKEVLDVMIELAREMGTAVLFITHDLGLVAKYADDVAVMCAGEVLETGRIHAVLAAPESAYTHRLLASAAVERAAAPKPGHGKPLVTVKDARIVYGEGKWLLRRAKPHEALKCVSLDIREGETLAIVGESGSGKTTLGRALLGLVPLTSGRITYSGIELRARDSKSLGLIRGRAQMIFQDPYSSLDPRLRALDIVSEGLSVNSSLKAAGGRGLAMTALREVGLSGLEDRYPHQMSGGQRQRLCIARALAVQPTFIVADEPVAALDATIQAQILDLLANLKRARDLTCVFISHDLGAVERIADRVAILRRGEVVECGPVTEIFAAPAHAYTRALLNARPRLRSNGHRGFRLEE